MTARTPHTTWEPVAEAYDRNDNGKLDRRERRELPDSAFAFPAERALPLVDAEHVRAALARFDQVAGVSDAARTIAFANTRKAAAHYGVAVAETRWQDLGREPHTPNRARD